MLKFGKKLKTLYQLILEYKNMGSLLPSLADYYKIKHLGMEDDERCGDLKGRLQIHRLPHSLYVAILSCPKYLRAYMTTFDEIYLWRIYNRLRDFVATESDIVLDLGAFIGLYTLKHFKAKQIFAVEPHPLSYSLLNINVRLNRLDNVKCFNYAIWSYDTTMTLFEEEFLISSSTLIPAWHEGYHSKQIIVRTTSIDSLIEQRLIPRYIDIAKVDIEGAEMRFLEGGVKTLQRGSIDRMVMEVHKVIGIDLKSFYARLGELGFRVVHIITGSETDIIYLKHVK